MVVCKCSFLDGKEVDITVGKDALGSDLFESVCKYVNIQDPTPFGLVFRGGSKSPVYNWWVRMNKPLRRQITGKCQVWAFALVVKFYPIHQIEKYEDVARYYSVIQVRNDLMTKRLPCPTNTLAILASFWLQSEHGDYTSDIIDRQLAEAFRFVRAGTQSKGKTDEEADIDFEEQMIELHRYLKDMPPSKADIKFLQLASSLPMYGIHYYPATELNFVPHSNLLRSRVKELGEQIILGLGDDGIFVHHDKKKKAHDSYFWKSIQSIAFKQNSITLKLHPISGNKDSEHLSFAFETIYQAKIVWRAAVDLHVHYRVENRNKAPQPLTVKLKRRWTILGKKQAKPVKAPPTPLVRRPQLSAIAENPPASVRRSRMSLHSKDETHPKEVEANRNADDIPTAHLPSLPFNPSKATSVRSHSSRKSTSPLTKRHATPTTSPKSGSRRNISKPCSRSSSPANVSKLNTSSPVLRHNERVASAVPARLRSGYTTSQTSTMGEEVLSEISDNTEILCSKNILEKAFSYHEEDGINSIQSWLELCSPRGNDKRGRPVSRSAPASQRSRSRGRSPVNEMDVDDIDDYKPFIKSKRPVVIKAKDLRDLSPPLTVHYEDEPSMRKPARYSSADNVARKDWTIRREPVHCFDPAARRFADIYRQEYLENVADRQDTYRRAKSMYSLASRNKERLPSSDYNRPVSPSTVSAIASSGSRRSCESYLGQNNYDDDFYRRICDLPVESNFTRRVLSENKLARANQNSRSYVPRDIAAAERRRRRNVTSWTFGDRDDFEWNEDALALTPERTRRQKQTIPELPQFIRSVR